MGPKWLKKIPQDVRKKIPMMMIDIVAGIA
jgi:hypothetical protein